MQKLLSFSEYLKIRDKVLFEQINEDWRNYLPFQPIKKFDPQRRQFLKTAAATAAAAGLATYAPQNEKIKYEPFPPYTGEMIKAIQNRFSNELKNKNLVITTKNIQFVKPREVLAPAWGNKFQSILDKAGEEQQKDMTTEFDQSITWVKNLDVPVMVIFIDPTLFGQDANGFHSTVLLKEGIQHFIVIKPDFNPSTLRHEMRHAMQNTLPYSPHDSFLDSGNDEFVVQYLAKMPELGVRFAELRLRYYQLTNKLVEDNEEDIKAMILHLSRNRDKYSIDVKQLLLVLSEMIKQQKVGVFLDYMRKNMMKYVKGNPSMLPELRGSDQLGYA